MQRSHFIKDALALWKETKHSERNGISLRLRLFSFFSLFLLAVFTGVILVLNLTGTLDTTKKESQVRFQNELEHLTQDINNEFGKLSLQGISLSENLTVNMENELKTRGIAPAALKENPNVIVPLLHSQMAVLCTQLKSVRASGAFLLLDATVNPSNRNASYSKAGIYLKSTEPNIVNATDLSIQYLRGPASIARSQSIELLPQWRLEFDTSHETFFETAMLNARSHKLPVSRLYYWTKRCQMEGNYESAMILCVPLISKDGTVFGLCGFEVSSMLFKLSKSPDNTKFPHIFSTLTPVLNDKINLDHGLIAGNYYMTNYNNTQTLSFGPDTKDFMDFNFNGTTEFKGFLKDVSLYPKDSPYQSERWAAAVLVPSKDLTGQLSKQKFTLLTSFTILMLFCLFLAFFISKRYIHPVISALNLIKKEDRHSLPKTNILEIDDLFEFLSAQDEALEQNKQKAESEAEKQLAATVPFSDVHFSGFQEFVQNISTLSTAERAVFNLYMDGRTAKEITEILCLSINTIKTHNRRIFNKLNVSSRKELMVYIKMMKEAQEKINQ